MPIFSIYQAVDSKELPACLNLFNFRHYLLLAYWVYFRPTALKSYLYEVNPAFYRAAPGLHIFGSIRIAAYRNLYLMILAASFVLAILLGLPFLLTLCWQTGRSINWLWWLIGTIVGVAVGAIFFIIFLVVFGVAVSIARGLVAGLVVGLATSVAVGVLFGVVFSISEVLQPFNTRGQSEVIVAFALSFGLATGVSVGIAIGGAIGTAVGLCLGSTSSVLVSMVFSIIASMMPAIESAKDLTGIAFGVAIGIAAIAAGGAAVSTARGTIASVVICGAVGIAVGSSSGWQFGFLTAAVAVFCALRIPFYIIEFFWSLRSSDHAISHPLEWDELLIFRLPGAQRTLMSALQRNQQQGFSILCNLTCNPFQRWVAQRTLKTYFHQQPSPFRSLYALLTHPAADAYIFAPITSLGWERLPAIKQVLLGELNSRWVDCTIDPTGSLIERLIYCMTLPLRHLQPTSLTHFAGLLFQLLDRKAPDSRTGMLNLLTSNRLIYADLTDYSEGQEIQQSFEVMLNFLACERLSALPQAIDAASKLPAAANAIRPQISVALHRLQNIGLDMITYLTAVSRVNKQAALLRANNALDELDDYIDTEVRIPEYIILKQIIDHWQRLVSEAGGRIGRVETLVPVPNPYVVGNPVIGEIFVGREDIIQRLEELWLNPQPPSVILYGHRRMGKSSILHNLKAHLAGQTIVIDFNMQIVGSVNSTNELLYALALELYDGLPSTQQLALEEPQQNHFNLHNPYHLLWRFLKQLDRIRDQHRFIITIDEFEILEELIRDNVIEQRLIGFWRGLIQTFPWFMMIFAGLHTLDEMRKDYWSPLFSSITAVPVSFLPKSAVQKLVTQPSPDFDIEYDHEVVQAIYHLTNGQPYLTQLIGHTLVTRFNQQVFEQGRSVEKRFTLENLESVIHSPEFYRDGDAYFAGVWRRAEVSQPHGQSQILCQLCRANLTQAQLVEQTNLSADIIQTALEVLQRHDVIKQEEDCYTYTVELMRRWVDRVKSRLYRE